MPEYLAPGVYIEEFESGARPIEGVSTSTAGILGKTERGPVEPRLVTSFASFQRLYGSYLPPSDMAYAVEGFFKNGGQRAFIGRIVPSSTATPAATASLTLVDDLGNDAIRVDALGDGAFGNRINITVGPATLSDLNASPPENPDLFQMTVEYFQTTDFTQEPVVTEVFDNLSPATGSSESVEKRINDISNLIVVEREATDVEERLADLPRTALAGGAEEAGDPDLNDYQGSTEPGERTGLSAFEEVDFSLLLAPDVSSDDPIALELITYCENLKSCFAILAFPPNPGPIGQLRPPTDSQYAAAYYPQIYVLDPVTLVNKRITPVGHVAGVYARSDTERGVHKAPANEVLRGVTKLEFQLTTNEQAILNPRGVNVNRVFEGRGIRVWGARTFSSNSLWKYINVRRLFIFLEESIFRGTQFVVFEPNDEKLWGRVKLTITAFLTTVWRSGALFGSTPDQAFYVKVDRSTMTEDDIASGRLIVVIGVAPVRPAEFVIFRITQYTAEA